jgi:hypothetical protein
MIRIAMIGLIVAGVLIAAYVMSSKKKVKSVLAAQGTGPLKNEDLKKTDTAVNPIIPIRTSEKKNPPALRIVLQPAQPIVNTMATAEVYTTQKTATPFRAVVPKETALSVLTVPKQLARV